MIFMDEDNITSMPYSIGDRSKTNETKKVSICQQTLTPWERTEKN